MLLVLELAFDVLEEMTAERFSLREVIINSLGDVVIGIFLAAPELNGHALRCWIIFVTVNV